MEEQTWLCRGINDVLEAEDRARRARHALNSAVAENLVRIHHEIEAEAENQRKIMATIDDNLKRATRRIAKVRRELQGANTINQSLAASDIRRLRDTLDEILKKCWSHI